MGVAADFEFHWYLLLWDGVMLFFAASLFSLSSLRRVKSDSCFWNLSQLIKSSAPVYPREPETESRRLSAFGIRSHLYRPSVDNLHNRQVSLAYGKAVSAGSRCTSAFGTSSGLVDAGGLETSTPGSAGWTNGVCTVAAEFS
jgi:hypothetical protein